MKEPKKPEGIFFTRMGKLQYCMYDDMGVRVCTQPDQSATVNGTNYTFDVNLALKEGKWVVVRHLISPVKKFEKLHVSPATIKSVHRELVRAWTFFVRNDVFVTKRAIAHARWRKLTALFSMRDLAESVVVDQFKLIAQYNKQINELI